MGDSSTLIPASPAPPAAHMHTKSNTIRGADRKAAGDFDGGGICGTGSDDTAGDGGDSSAPLPPPPICVCALGTQDVSVSMQESLKARLSLSWFSSAMAGKVRSATMPARKVVSSWKRHAEPDDDSVPARMDTVQDGSTSPVTSRSAKAKFTMKVLPLFFR